MLAGLAPSALAPLARAATRVSYQDGEQIVADGQPHPPVGFVVSGGVRVYRTSSSGRQQTLARLAPGAALYLPPAFDDDPASPASSEALSPTVLLQVPRDQFRRMASEHPELALAVMRELSGRLRQFVDLAHDLGMRTVRSRLARFLVQEIRGGSSDLVELSHEQIATSIGSVREVVSRALAIFERDGLVRVGRQRIEVCDLDGLDAIADDH